MMRKKMYRCEVELFYKDHSKNYEVCSVKREFKGKSKQDVYEYLKYYTLKFGMCDVKMHDEGEV